MVNWTDPIIHWNQLPGTEVKRLLDTWGKDEAFIAKYDKKHGYAVSPVKTPAKTVTKSATKTEATTPAKAVKKATTVAPKKAVVRQKHTGPDGAVKYVEHRELYVGFFGGKVVVTKRTEAACREVLAREYGVEPVGSWETVTV
jgi:hypothetical protein